MDGDITIPRTLQTDGIVAAAAKRERQSGNPRRFQTQLGKERKPFGEAGKKTQADEPADAKDAQPRSESSAPPAAADQAGLLDFEA